MKTLYVILHLVGVAVGAGGAFTSDTLFFHFLKKGHFSLENTKVLKVASRMVWIGLLLLITSGVLIFLSAPEYYLSSAKFLAKMSIVLVITINGLVFHLVHIKRMNELRDGLFISGAISITSWLWAIILGVLRSVPWSYGTVMLLYLGTIFLAIIISILLGKKVRKTSLSLASMASNKK